MTQCRKIMIQGTMSGAGKSLLVTALCRIFHEDGMRVAPFKSQNMALNSYITADGLEMGRAQAAQAEACGKLPDVRMNPILLKPTSDVGSQLIVNGRVRGTYRAADYFRMKKTLVPDIMEAFRSLEAENDVIVIEGAGSPAEINLKSDDIVNMGLASMVDAPVILVGDIDPGGVFAQLYGTIMLLTEDERARIAGTVINKFRGDAEILRPGLSMLEELTKVPVLGVVPYADIDIDDEDSLSQKLAGGRHDRPIDIAVIRFPRISNFTDITPLTAHPYLGVRYVERPENFGQPDLVILPGTKNTLDDLLWLRENGLETRILRHAQAGGMVLGICGGFQMLGESLSDPEGSDSGRAGSRMRGLGLLPAVTIFSSQKTRRQVKGSVCAGELAGASVTGYEIHMGETRVANGTDPFARVRYGTEADSYVRNRNIFGSSDETRGDDENAAGSQADGCVNGSVFGTYIHGLFDTGELTEKLASYLMKKRGIAADSICVESRTSYKERQYARLADIVRRSLDMEAVCRALR
jgi:adenosylcobyric acid synthase